MGASAWPRSAALRLALFLGLLASAACTPLELKTKIPIVRIALTPEDADPANGVIAPVAGDRASCLAFVAGGESSLPESFDAERGIDKYSPGYYKRLARTLTHLKAMVAAYRLGAPAVLILDEAENPVRHPDFAWADDSLDAFVRGLEPDWTHVQLSVLAFSDSFGVLARDWDAAGRPEALRLTPRARARPNTELWSYGAYLVSKTGLANTLLAYSNRDRSASSGSVKTLQFDLSSASCIEADNCLLWEGVKGEGWFVATPPLLAPSRQVTYDEADAPDVEVAVSELVKQNMYHARRWWKTPDDLLDDAEGGSLSLPSDRALDAMMREVGVEPTVSAERVTVSETPSRASIEEESYPASGSTTTASGIDRASYRSPSDDADAFATPEFEERGERPARAERSDASRFDSDAAAYPSSADPDPDPDPRVVDDRFPLEDAGSPGAEAAAAAAVVADPSPLVADPSPRADALDPAPASASAARRPQTPQEAARQRAAGITRTESAFEYGKSLFNRAWGYEEEAPAEPEPEPVPAEALPAAEAVPAYPAARTVYPEEAYVAAAGAVVSDPNAGYYSPAEAARAYPGSVAEPVAAADDVATLLSQYQSEPRLGAARRERVTAALGAYRRGKFAALGAAARAEEGPASSSRGAAAGLVGVAASAAAAAGLAVGVVAAAIAARRRAGGDGAGGTDGTAREERAALIDRSGTTRA